MDSLRNVALTFPAIDNHAHPILTSRARDSLPLEGVFSEASTHKNTPYTLGFMRGFRQLLELFGLPYNTTWEEYKKWRNQKDYDELCNECMKGYGLQCLLLDDGLPGQVMKHDAHDRFMASPSMRVERIEPLAESVIEAMLRETDIMDMDVFSLSLQAGLKASEAVAFKSVIAYRGGLDIPSIETIRHKRKSEIAREWEACASEFKQRNKVRLGRSKKLLGALVVILAADVALQHDKPIQFHIGIGDSDLDLPKASPAHLQPFIAAFPGVKIVLLHAAYPFTREAGYLASVYNNVYLDISLIFPVVSRTGQKDTLSQVFELCPTNKILFSTDAHFWPETYYLANLQARQALLELLTDLVSACDISEEQGVQIAKNTLFYNSNKLYGLMLEPIAQ